MRRALVGIGASCLLGLICGAGPAAAQAAGSEPSYQELLRLLETAKPAPNPVPRDRALPGSTDPGESVRHDLATGETKKVPRSRRSQANKVPGAPGAGGPRRADGQRTRMVPLLPSPESRDARSTTPTPPTPVTEVLSFPWNTVSKMLMRFNVNGTNFYYVCSAASMGSFHALTAGHCIYNWDPNDDDNTSDRRWADEVWVWAAQTDRVAPIGTLDHPYGLAKATLLRSWTNWTDGQDLNHDYGLVTLDRRLGDRTGWMGLEANVTTASLNFNGYPAETPFVPDDEYRQYPGFDANNVVNYTANRINLDAFTYGGHSGGPAWRFESPNRWVHGINSTSNRVGSAGETRITNFIIDDILAARNNDAAPTPLPNLIEYLWPTDAKDLLTNVVQQGDPISVEYNFYNAGFAATNQINVNFYLSTNNIISTGDSFIGTRTFSSLGANTFINTTTSLTVPAAQPIGTYFVGWIMNTSPETETGDNTVVISTETVEVRERPLPPAAVTNLISPSGQIFARRPTFQWSPAARATEYVLNVRQGTTPVFGGTFTASALGCADGVSTCRIRTPVSERLNLGRHNWRVRSKNAVGAAAFSPIENFRIVAPSRIAAVD